MTRPGRYSYDLKGTAQQPFGGTQQLSGTQSFVVDPPTGSTQHGRTSGQDGSEDLTLLARRSGLYVRDIHVDQQGFDEDFRPDRAALYFPAKHPTGSHWSWGATSTDGKYRIAVNSKVSGATTRDVDGHRRRALVTDSTLHITGTGIDIVDQQRDWVSTKFALILDEHAVTHGSAYGASFSSDVTRSLRRTSPA